MLEPDPHRAWLKDLRRLSVRLGDGLSDDCPGSRPLKIGEGGDRPPHHFQSFLGVL